MTEEPVVLRSHQEFVELYGREVSPEWDRYLSARRPHLVGLLAGAARWALCALTRHEPVTFVEELDVYRCRCGREVPAERLVR
ncbi:MAG TPA: hypothetical protein VF192_01365 [Longimicrobiales bacterium]